MSNCARFDFYVQRITTHRRSFIVKQKQSTATAAKWIENCKKERKKKLHYRTFILKICRRVNERIWMYFLLFFINKTQTSERKCAELSRGFYKNVHLNSVDILCLSNTNFFWAPSFRRKCCCCKCNCCRFFWVEWIVFNISVPQANSWRPVADMKYNMQSDCLKI